VDEIVTLITALCGVVGVVCVALKTLGEVKRYFEDLSRQRRKVRADVHNIILYLSKEPIPSVLQGRETTSVQAALSFRESQPVILLGDSAHKRAVADFIIVDGEPQEQREVRVTDVQMLERLCE
jgi:hypothetical protein